MAVEISQVLHDHSVRVEETEKLLVQLRSRRQKGAALAEVTNVLLGGAASAGPLDTVTCPDPPAADGAAPWEAPTVRAPDCEPCPSPQPPPTPEARSAESPPSTGVADLFTKQRLTLEPLLLQVEESRQSLFELQRSLGALPPHLESCVNACKHSISRGFAALRKQLDQKEAELLLKLDQLHHKHTTEVATTAEAAGDLLDVLERCVLDAHKELAEDSTPSHKAEFVLQRRSELVRANVHSKLAVSGRLQEDVVRLRDAVTKSHGGYGFPTLEVIADNVAQLDIVDLHVAPAAAAPPQRAPHPAPTTARRTTDITFTDLRPPRPSAASDAGSVQQRRRDVTRSPARIRASTPPTARIHTEPAGSVLHTPVHDASRGRSATPTSNGKERFRTPTDGRRTIGQERRFVGTFSVNAPSLPSGVFATSAVSRTPGPGTYNMPSTFRVKPRTAR